ncbi:MAG: hypothetical protein HQL73_02235 [Magnetococcales bacterium]|nr:hypothetical protein [Magnetococcales bacterium]
MGWVRGGVGPIPVGGWGEATKVILFHPTVFPFSGMPRVGVMAVHRKLQASWGGDGRPEGVLVRSGVKERWKPLNFARRHSFPRGLIVAAGSKVDEPLSMLLVAKFIRLPGSATGK